MNLSDRFIAIIAISFIRIKSKYSYHNVSLHYRNIQSSRIKIN